MSDYDLQELNYAIKILSEHCNNTSCDSCEIKNKLHCRECENMGIAYPYNWSELN